ncbi:MAG: putative Holliday junction resolvase [Acidimicrobiales bacterium]|nr:putative Holliday junction resolvase [Acidimicrobiales bacterium]
MLALDLGARRIGVAVCDAAERVASPVVVLQRSKDVAQTHRDVAELVADWEAELVVVGLPLALDGSTGPAAEGVLRECDELRAVLDVPVEVHDERLTTVTAERALREQDLDGRARRKVVDMVAASIILQDWLDRRSNAPRDPAPGAAPPS